VRRRHDLRSDDPGWEPLAGEASPLLRALQAAMHAAAETSARNVFRLVEEQEVSLQQGKAAAEAYERVEILPSGLRVVDRRRVR
jgi:hypothetical protein